jgi:hypothetical protein
MAGFSVDDLISAFRPESTVHTVDLGRGFSLTFRTVTDASELASMKTRAEKFAKILYSKACTPALVAVRPENRTVAVNAWFLSQVATDPKWSQADWLKLARDAAFVFEAAFQAMNEAQTRAEVESESTIVEELGEFSALTVGADQSSPSRETSSENIPTT